MIWVAAPAREWVHMWVQEEEDFDSQLPLNAEGSLTKRIFPPVER
jgi:hypothetical protein